MNVRFFGVLAGSSFKGTVFTGSAFLTANLYNVDACSTQMKNVEFFAVFAEHLRLDDATLSRVSFLSCNLGAASLLRASLKDVVFEDADLSEVDFSGATLNGVVFRRCQNVGSIRPASLARLLSTNAEVVVERFDGMQEGVLGESGYFGSRPAVRVRPRSNDQIIGPSHPLQIRYSVPTIDRVPPFGYRVELATEILLLLVAVFPNYKSARRRILASTPASSRAAVGDISLPRRPLLLSAALILGLPTANLPGQWRGAADMLASMLFENLLQVSRDAGTVFETEPQLLIVESKAIDAKQVTINGVPYLYMTSGMALFCTRLTKYLTGMVLPLAVVFEEDEEEPVTPATAEQVYSRLRAGLVDVRDGSDPSQLPLIQIGGLRLLESRGLAMTWEAFVLAHELGHAMIDADIDCEGILHSIRRDIASLDYDPKLGSAEEIICDIFAARMVSEKLDYLDGDREMLDGVRSTREVEIRFRKREMKAKGIDIDSLGTDWDATSAEFLAGLDYIGKRAQWFETAISLFLILRLSRDSALGSPQVAFYRALLVCRMAWGDDRGRALLDDANDGSTILSNIIFAN